MTAFRAFSSLALLLAAPGLVYAASPLRLNVAYKQFSTIRPTHRLVKEESRTTRQNKSIPGMPERKSGNISPLRRELPEAAVAPPKTRRRQIGW